MKNKKMKKATKIKPHHIKHTIDQIIRLASKKGFAEWKKMSKSKHRGDVNSFVKKAIDSETDKEFRKYITPKEHAPEFDFLQTPHESSTWGIPREAAATSHEERATDLKTHYEAELHRLASVLQRL